MDSGDTTTIALAGIIATAAVGFVGPAITAAVSLRTRRDETRAQREDDLRKVIEDAAIRLTEAISRLDKARDKMVDHVPNPMIDALDVDAEQLWLNEDKIGVRIGTAAPEAIHFSAAVDAWLRAYRHIGELSDGLEKDASELRSIAIDRNAAFESAQAFKNASAARLSPEATARSRRAARRAARSHEPAPDS